QAHILGRPVVRRRLSVGAVLVQSLLTLGLDHAVVGERHPDLIRQRVEGQEKHHQGGGHEVEQRGAQLPPGLARRRTPRLRAHRSYARVRRSHNGLLRWMTPHIAEIRSGWRYLLYQNLNCRTRAVSAARVLWRSYLPLAVFIVVQASAI